MPDRPRPFAAGRTWFAVRAADPSDVVRALKLRTVLPANWQAGLAEVVTQGVFVTPPVAGWVFAVGRDVAARTADPAEVESLTVALASEFGEAFWFMADAERDVFGWARGERGRWVRAYAFAEEHGHYLWHGDISPEEHALACFRDDPRDRSDDDVKWWPDEVVVCALAGLWASDPSQITSDAAPAAAGFLGRL